RRGKSRPRTWAKTSRAARASSTLAAVTTTASKKPRESTRIWRLRPCTFFAAVGPPFRAPQRGLDRLAVDRRRTGRQHPPGLNAGQGAKDVEDLLPGAVRVPIPEVVIHAVPGREVVGQGTPRAAFPGVIEQGVDDLAQIYLTRPTGSGAARGLGE